MRIICCFAECKPKEQSDQLHYSSPKWWKLVHITPSKAPFLKPVEFSMMELHKCDRRSGHTGSQGSASGFKISGQETFLFPIHSAVIVLLHSNWAQRWLLLSRSPTILQRPSSLLLYVDIIPLYFIPSVIAMVVVIEVCQLHTYS